MNPNQWFLSYVGQRLYTYKPWKRTENYCLPTWDKSLWLNFGFFPNSIKEFLRLILYSFIIDFINFNMLMYSTHLEKNIFQQSV